MQYTKLELYTQTVAKNTCEQIFRSIFETPRNTTIIVKADRQNSFFGLHLDLEI